MDWAFLLEAPPGIEPGIEVLQTFALPLGHSALCLSGFPDYIIIFPLGNIVAKKLGAIFRALSFGADYGARTRHLRLGKATLYQMS